MRFTSLDFAMAILLVVTSACGKRPGTEIIPGNSNARTTQPPTNEPISSNSPIEKLNVLYLPNAIRIHAKVISGGMPEGDRAFAELQSLGVKTVISVDGAKPDVSTAEKYGLHYVHLPHGYDGIPQPRVLELAKAVRDLPGPIYLHCHHGKHRIPVAATVACVAAGLIEKGQVNAILTVAGTSENYRGLFESANGAQRIEAALLDQLQAELPSIAKLPVLA